MFLQSSPFNSTCTWQDIRKSRGSGSNKRTTGLEWVSRVVRFLAEFSRVAGIFENRMRVVGGYIRGQNFTAENVAMRVVDAVDNELWVNNFLTGCSFLQCSRSS